MLKLQKIYASESGPWNQTTGSKNISFDINSQDVADLTKSYVILRTSLAVAARPTNTCVRLPSFGYLNTQSAQTLPVAYSASCMLRDVRVDTEKQGTLEATSFVNYKAGALRPYTVSQAANRVRACFGEGWSPLIADDGTVPTVSQGYQGQYNNGNYSSAWTYTRRSGAVPSTYSNYVDMCVPLSEVMGLGKLDAVTMGSLGHTLISFSIEEQATLATVYARSNTTGYVSYPYTIGGAADTIVVDLSARNATGECPFWIGMGLTCTATVSGNVFECNVVEINIANSGIATIEVTNIPDGAGTLYERVVDPNTEGVTWEISRAALVLATKKTKIPRNMKLEPYAFKTWIDIPYNPNTTNLVSNSFTLPAGTIAAFFVNSTDGVVTSLMGSTVRARFALNNKDLTNRSMQTYPASALYHDQLAQALMVSDFPIKSLDTDIYTVLPACTMSPTAPNDQLLLTMDLSANHPGGRCHLLCLVERPILM